jgi:hypothetical protein
MASYFVAAHGTPQGEAAVHESQRCPPGRFPPASSEYLGEFLETAQAVAVARLRYANARGCSCEQAEAAALLVLADA